MRASLYRVRHIVSAAAVGLAALSTARGAQAQIPTSITFFGDSFLDTGNGDILSQLFLNTDLTPSPPYAPGRVTNGFNWADYLAALFGRPGDAMPTLAPPPFTGRNYAVGTATTGLTGFNGAAQIGLLSQYAGQAGQMLDPTGLYVIFGGANDLLGAASLADPAARSQAIASAVQNIGTITAGLYSQGARNFLIPNLPNIGLAPTALGKPSSPILSAEVVQFNALLTAGLAQSSAQLIGSKIMSLNLNNLFTNILIDAAAGGPKYGLTNTTVPCLVPVQINCDNAVFADDLHPTTKVHALIANAAYARVVTGTDVAVVPEPATLLLVGCGLLVCGAAARRKKQS